MKLTNLISLPAMALQLIISPPHTGYSEVQSPATPAPSAPVQPTPPTGDLPRNLNEVAKLASTGVGDDVILAYVKNSQSAYNLSANNILQLKNLGVSSQVITGMINHDLALRGNASLKEADYSQKLYSSTNQPIASQSVAPPAPPVALPAAEPSTNGVQTSVAPPVVVPAPMVTAPLTPPAAQVEVMPIAPGPDYYWAPGYWSWDGGWVWVGGRWNVRLGYGWGGHYHGWGGYHRGWAGHRR